MTLQCLLGMLLLASVAGCLQHINSDVYVRGIVGFGRQYVWIYGKISRLLLISVSMDTCINLRKLTSIFLLFILTQLLTHGNAPPLCTNLLLTQDAPLQMLLAITASLFCHARQVTPSLPDTLIIFSVTFFAAKVFCCLYTVPIVSHNN